MKVKIEIDIIPFAVPTEVFVKKEVGLKQDGFQPLQRIPLHTLPIETLESLCDEFKKSVMNARIVNGFKDCSYINGSRDQYDV